MPIKATMIQHLIYLKGSVEKLNFCAHIDIASCCAEVHMGLRSHTLYPQFIVFVDGTKHYTSDFTNDVIAFCGWRPYRVNIIKEIANKLEVKKLMQLARLPTPEYSDNTKMSMKDVIVKKSISSFGFTIQGPYRKSEQHELNSEDEEYYEKYIEGIIVKSWYWNNEPICYEYQEMPNIIGDGKLSIRQHLNPRIESNKHKPCMTIIQDVLAYYGYKIDDVLENNKKLVVDFRYGSKFGLGQDLIDARIEDNDAIGIYEQLRVFGEFAKKIIPDDMKNGIIYSVDSICDLDGKLWFLEINSNPMVHPYLYAPMLEHLYNITDTECLANISVK